MNLLINAANAFETSHIDLYKIIDGWIATNMNTEIKYSAITATGLTDSQFCGSHSDEKSRELNVSDTKCQNIVFNNYGTLFYYACVIDNCELLSYIINYAQIHNITIDINYRNKNLNNDSCLLHVVKFGYIDCLSVLLGIEMIDYYMLNDHISFTLGQTVTVNDAGHQNILFIALENNQYECLDLLFTKLPDYVLQKLKMQFNIYKESFETVLNKKYSIYTRVQAPNVKQNALYKELLLFATKHLPTIELKVIENIKLLCQTQQKQLNTIINLNQHTVCTGLQAPNVMQTATGVNSAFSVLETTINTFDITCEYKCIVPSVYKLTDKFPVDLCKSMLSSFKDYREIALQKNYPIYIRHDNNMGMLDKCGFGNIITKFVKLINKFLLNNNITNVTQVCSACFLIENFIGVEKTFAIHKDDSDFTFNLCLERSDDLLGSEIDFYDDSESPEYKYTHELGAMVIHPGNKLHKANNIKKGARSSLIIWTKNIS